MSTEKNIKTPQDMWEHFEDYRKDCKANPRKENFYNAREDKQISVDREKPLTWTGFAVYLRKTEIIAKIDDYRFNKDKRYDDYASIIRNIDTEIYEDKITGATAGIYQHNIIARDLGLREKTETEMKAKVTVDDMTPEERDQRIKKLIEKANK